MSYNQTQRKTAKKTNSNINNNSSNNNFYYFLRKNGETKAKNQKWHLHAINTFCDVDQTGFKLPIMCSPIEWAVEQCQGHGLRNSLEIGCYLEDFRFITLKNSEFVLNTVIHGNISMLPLHLSIKSRTASD